MPTIEFRHRTTTNTPWELQPVMHVQSFPKHLTYKDLVIVADIAARALANEVGAEVRWNFEGGTQGHYVSPTA